MEIPILRGKLKFTHSTIKFVNYCTNKDTLMFYFYSVTGRTSILHTLTTMSSITTCTNFITVSEAMQILEALPIIKMNHLLEQS